MQLPWDEHFWEIVIPAWQAFLVAEQRLVNAVTQKDEGAIRCTSYEALREAGAAAFYVHHFAEIVLRARPEWLPREVASTDQVRAWLGEKCFHLRTKQRTKDVSLLRDVADSLKHAVLTRRNADVAANDAVLVLSSGYGQLRYGEGNYGGTEQVLVLAHSGTRTLSGILQNVIDAWRRAIGVILPPIGAP